MATGRVTCKMDGELGANGWSIDGGWEAKEMVGSGSVSKDGMVIGPLTVTMVG